MVLTTQDRPTSIRGGPRPVPSTPCPLYSIARMAAPVLNAGHRMRTSCRAVERCRGVRLVKRTAHAVSRIARLVGGWVACEP
jgi:hypothetical protein